MPICVLPIHLVNKIAAGEVIERPASVVKELVENSIDAGSTRIDIAVQDGGSKSISVSDNGKGLAGEDLALAFVPHATSKIQQEDDLFAINTMGFRGEALAAIASVSHAHIRSRSADSPEGMEIDASGETISQARPCAATAGTTVTIRDLFFNTPARRKFMRTVNTEFGHISEQVTRLALPNPQIAFTLTNNGREVLKLPTAESTMQRAEDLFGRQLAQTLLTIQSRDGRIGVQGLAGRPGASRASSQWQYFFLNGRYIRDRLLSHALKEAYRGLVDPRSFPVAFIFITIDPAEVDVNVHPTKIEVRFRDSQSVHGHLLAALRETLGGSNLTGLATARPVDLASTAGEADPNDPTSSAGLSAEARQRQQSARQAMADFFRSIKPAQGGLGFPNNQPGQGATIPSPAQPAGPAWQQPGRPVANESPAIQQGLVANSPQLGWPAMQIHNSYIVTSCDDGLLIIDQHALHERILYNDFKRRLSQGQLPAQRMLIPPVVSASPAAISALLARSAMLESLGIEVAAFGPTSLAIQRFPSLLVGRGVVAEEFLLEAMDKLAEEPSAAGEHLLESLLQSLACKAAIKAGMALSADEMQSLLAQRQQTDKASACPHGRPTVLKMTLKDLEKQFKRT
jgi:DNA mismatch repair protein MutL